MIFSESWSAFHVSIHVQFFSHIFDISKLNTVWDGSVINLKVIFFSQRRTNNNNNKKVWPLLFESILTLVCGSIDIFHLWTNKTIWGVELRNNNAFHFILKKWPFQMHYCHSQNKWAVCIFYGMCHLALLIATGSVHQSTCLTSSFSWNRSL